MMLRQFLLTTQNAPAGTRAEAAAALAKAYLHGNLGSDAAWEAKTALLGILDDSSAMVRRALAEACASSARAPRPLIVALASDQPDIACLVLARSPVLMEADLVDCAAIGCETVRSAIAGRADLSKPVAAALAEVAGPESLIVMARNPLAEIGKAACLRMVERHGEVADLREAMLARHDLCIEARHAIAAQVAQSLSRFGRDCGWLSAERGERVSREARDCAALLLGDEAGEAGLARLVAHLRATGQLSSGLILRAILSLRMPFAEAALSDLSGLSRARVAGLMLEPRGAGFAALHRRSGLPALLLPAIQAALSAWRESATGRSADEGARLARRMIERALTACEDLPFAEARGLMALLARFEAEAARDEAREAAHALAIEAERDEILRLEAQDLTQLHDTPISDEVEGPQAPLPGERLGAWPSFEAASDALAPVLDALPDAILASYRAEQDRREKAATEQVLDGLGSDLISSYFAANVSSTVSSATIAAATIDLAHPEPRSVAPAVIVEAIAADPDTRPEPELLPEPARKVSLRPRDVALAVVAGMMPRARAAGREIRIAA